MRYIPRDQILPFGFDALQIRDYMPGASAAQDACSIAEIEVPPGADHRARSRRCEKFYYALEADVTFEIDDRVLSLQQGDVLAIPRDQWFRYTNRTARSIKLLLIHVPPFDPAAEEVGTGSRPPAAAP